MKNTINKYENFHQLTSIQKKIISENNFTYRLILKVLNKYLKPNSKVLDIGSGAGTLALYVANRGNKVLGIEISEKAVKSARESASLLGLKNVEFEVVKFPDKKPSGKFDLVIFTEVIEHLEDDVKAVREITKMLNKNGIVLISTPSKNAPLHRLGYAKEFDKRVGHIRRYSIDELSKICEESGLKVVEVKEIEGIVRNFLFLSPIAGKLVRYIKFSFSDVVTSIDNLTVPFFGESNIIVVAQKVKQ